MCLVAMAHGVSERYPLIVVANRDEFHARPTKPFAAFDEAPKIFGGRDLEKGGTWLGVHRDGRVAALTNVRRPDARRGERSRGALVVAALEGGRSSLSALLDADGAHFPAFNLLLFERGTLYAASESEPSPRPVALGVHGLSNDRLDTPWPKVVRLKSALTRFASDPTLSPEVLFEEMSRTTSAPDDELPSTGVPLPLERALSPAFIRGPVYGTRSTTLILVEPSGLAHVEERSFGPEGSPLSVVVTTIPTSSFA